MSEIENDAFEELTEQKMLERQTASASGMHAKAKRLQREIDAMFRQKYGDEPGVGSGGRNV